MSLTKKEKRSLNKLVDELQDKLDEMENICEEALKMPLTNEDEILIQDDEMTGIHTNTGFYKEKVKQTFQEILKEIEETQETFWQCNECKTMCCRSLGLLIPQTCACGNDLNSNSTKRIINIRAESIIKKHIPEEWRIEQEARR